MPEDSTRRLLRAFGIAMTDCEDALVTLTAALGQPGGAPVAALETYGKTMRELSRQWVEVNRLILEYHGRAHDAVEAHVRARSGP